jgi:hypothetical protein
MINTQTVQLGWKIRSIAIDAITMTADMTIGKGYTDAEGTFIVLETKNLDLTMEDVTSVLGVIKDPTKPIMDNVIVELYALAGTKLAAM